MAKPQHVVAVVDGFDTLEGPWYCRRNLEPHDTLVGAYDCDGENVHARRSSDHMGGFIRAPNCGASGIEHGNHPFRIIRYKESGGARIQYPCLCRDSRYAMDMPAKADQRPPTAEEVVPMARPAAARKPKACCCPPECGACRRVKVGETVCKHCESHKLNPAWGKWELEHLHARFRVYIKEPAPGIYYATGPGKYGDEAPHTVGLPRWWP